MPLILNGDGSIGPLSATEVGYLDGITSAVQTQINNKYSVGSTLASFSFGTIASLGVLREYKWQQTGLSATRNTVWDLFQNTNSYDDVGFLMKITGRMGWNQSSIIAGVVGGYGLSQTTLASNANTLVLQTADISTGFKKLQLKNNQVATVTAFYVHAIIFGIEPATAINGTVS